MRQIVQGRMQAQPRGVGGGRIQADAGPQAPQLGALRLQPAACRHAAAGLRLAALRQHRIAQRQRCAHRRTMAVVAQRRLLQVLAPGLTQEGLDRRRQHAAVRAALQALVHSLHGQAPRLVAALLGALQFGGAALGDLHPAPVLLVGAAEFRLQGQEHRQVFVEIAHHPLHHALRLRQQHLLDRAVAGVAVASIGQQVEQTPRRMPVAHEQAAVDQRHLGQRHQHLPEQFALRRLQHAFVEHDLEQQPDQVQGARIGRLQAGGGRIQPQRRTDRHQLPAQALRQRPAVFADRSEAGQRRGLQQRQHRQQFARRQAAARVVRGIRRGRLRLVQQGAQCRRQYLLVVARMRVQRARGAADSGAAACQVSKKRLIQSGAASSPLAPLRGMARRRARAVGSERARATWSRRCSSRAYSSPTRSCNSCSQILTIASCTCGASTRPCSAA
nr:hypothetical protein [Xanthomonas translucens]